MRRSCTGDGYVTRGTSVAPRPIRANSKRRRHAARQRGRSLHPGRRQGAALRALSAGPDRHRSVRRFGPPTTDCKSLRRKCATLSSRRAATGRRRLFGRPRLAVWRRTAFGATFARLKSAAPRALARLGPAIAAAKLWPAARPLGRAAKRRIWRTRGRPAGRRSGRRLPERRARRGGWRRRRRAPRRFNQGPVRRRQ